MIGHWIAFGLLFPVTFFGVIGFKEWTKKFFKTEITPEMNKTANKKVIKIILFCWLCNLFYMSCFIDNLVCQYIFGSLILFVIFMNLAGAFTYPKERTGLEKWGLLQDFLLGIGLSIYLIYIIPNYNLRVIVIPVVAAVYGGLITLVGVGWTIRKSDHDRKEEQIQKNRPFVFIVNPAGGQAKNSIAVQLDYICLNDEVFSGSEKYSLDYFMIKNADYSFSSLKGICINNDLIFMSIAQVFDKEKTYRCICNLQFKYREKIKKVYLLLEDLFEHYYALEVCFEIVEGKGKKNVIHIVSGLELFKAKVDFDNYVFAPEKISLD